MTPERYAIYVLPDAADPWAAFCTKWLGWDAVAGERLAHPVLDNLDDPVSALTAVPRRYGLHATIKPPFRLAVGKSARGLERAAEDIARRSTPLSLDGLQITRLGRFLALTIDGDSSALNALAAEVVRGLDGYRAPPTAQELERRRAAQLSPAQEQNLTEWGYPHVMDSFRFHITLTGKLPRDDLPRVETALARHLAPLLPRPYIIRDLALVGEDADGFFHLLRRFPLGS